LDYTGWGNSASAGAIVFSTDFESARASNLHLTSDSTVAFSIPTDPDGSEYLWFNFKVIGAADKPLEFLVENASDAHQSGERWNITRPVFSSDGVHWTRAADISYAREFSLKNPLGSMRYRFWAPFAADTLQVAYCYPYPMAQLELFLNSLRNDPRCILDQLGLSEDGQGFPQLRLAAPGSAAATERRFGLSAANIPGNAGFLCLRGFHPSSARTSCRETAAGSFRVHRRPDVEFGWRVKVIITATQRSKSGARLGELCFRRGQGFEFSHRGRCQIGHLRLLVNLTPRMIPPRAFFPEDGGIQPDARGCPVSGCPFRRRGW